MTTRPLRVGLLLTAVAAVLLYLIVLTTLHALS